ncbi:hypothetical protein RJ639_022798 [Escallonia herrerae]|uniref:DUF4005 domain-containing protein n=1 Tax=Escallonia herrerae TaxID=1293975 RepID=A0AA89AEG9_9ASTE|nr:hypothetical protein RJ639_022798 [Escallonia herrerae]
MGKKRSWFSFVKRLFVPEAKFKEQKNSIKWGWVLGRLKLRKYPALTPEPETTWFEAKEEQRKHALAVAVAATAAAEAAITAAHAAAEVVRLTVVPDEFGKRSRNLAAIKIQSAYRAHLARTALRALKGIVKLQAVVRGQNVRRQVIIRLKCLPSIEKASSHVHHKRVQSLDEGCNYNEKKQFLGLTKALEEREMKLHCNSHKSWDYRLFSKEDVESLWSRKQEAITKRERMKRYSFSHRDWRNGQVLEDLINMEDGTQSHKFEQYTGTEAHRRRETDGLRASPHSNLTETSTYRRTQIKLKRGSSQDSVGELNSPISLPRRSFSRAKKQELLADDSSLPNSPLCPTYMAATESAKAKVRSMSTPKQRLGSLDMHSVRLSTFKPKLSSWSSFNGELTGANSSS